MKRTWLIVGTVALAAALPVLAQTGSASSEGGEGHADVGPARPPGAYQGVTPGGPSESPPAEGRVRAARSSKAQRGRRTPVRLLTWPGFQAREDGSSRFFLQTSQAVETATASAPGRFELVLKNTRVHLRTNALPLETRFFDTPVVRAVVERRGNDLAVVFHLRAEVTPRVSTEGAPSGYHYVYVDFPAGSYLPAEAATPEPAPSAPPP